MPVCDVCNRNLSWENGFVLTTNQVATSESYWEQAFTGAWAYTHDIDPAGDTVAMLAQQQAGQSSGWLICEPCSRMFSFDKEQARGAAHRHDSSPPGAGPAPVLSVARAAAEVWHRLYGSWPSSIRPS